MTSECDLGAKKWIKQFNNAGNVLRDIKLPLDNDMGHWNCIFWSLWKKSENVHLKPPFHVVRLSMLRFSNLNIWES